MKTVLFIECVQPWAIYGHFWPAVAWGRGPIAIPEPYQANEFKDICVYTGIGQRWAVKRRRSIMPFELPSPHYAPLVTNNIERVRP